MINIRFVNVNRMLKRNRGEFAEGTKRIIMLGIKLRIINILPTFIFIISEKPSIRIKYNNAVKEKSIRKYPNL